MSKQAKGFYRFLAWFFTIVIASGTLTGCAKYGPPPTSTKYGPPVHKSSTSLSAIKVGDQTAKATEDLITKNKIKRQAL